MSLDPPKPRRWPRIAGIVLIAAGGACVYLFIQYPTGTLANFGFPKAWRGGPLVLGAAFCWINGCFLLFQRRFSLGAFVLSGVVAGALAAAANAYVLSIHEAAVTTIVGMDAFMDKAPSTIDLVRRVLNAGNLNALVDDACRDGWQPGTDFFTVTPMIGVNSGKHTLDVTLTFEYSPYLHPTNTGVRGLTYQYCRFGLNWSDVRLYGELNANAVARDLSANAYGSYGSGLEFDLLALLYMLEGRTIWTPSPHTQTSRELDAKALKFLRDREPDPDLKKFFSDVLTEYERLEKESAVK